jgi:hypothetical protein
MVTVSPVPQSNGSVTSVTDPVALVKVLSAVALNVTGVPYVAVVGEAVKVVATFTTCEYPGLKLPAFTESPEYVATIASVPTGSAAVMQAALAEATVTAVHPVMAVELPPLGV